MKKIILIFALLFTLLGAETVCNEKIKATGNSDIYKVCVDKKEFVYVNGWRSGGLASSVNKCECVKVETTFSTTYKVKTIKD